MTQEIIYKGNLEYRLENNGGSGNHYQVTLVKCPACGLEFKDGSHKRWHFIQDHQPEDFGLSPLLQ